MLGCMVVGASGLYCSGGCVMLDDIGPTAIRCSSDWLK